MLEWCSCFSCRYECKAALLVVFAQSFCKTLLSTAWNSVTAALPASLEEMVPVLTKIDEITVSDLSCLCRKAIPYFTHIMQLFNINSSLQEANQNQHVCSVWVYKRSWQNAQALEALWSGFFLASFLVCPRFLKYQCSSPPPALYLQWQLNSSYPFCNLVCGLNSLKSWSHSSGNLS